jgi:hypothetical protein
MFTLPVIADKFQSVHTRDFLLLPLVLVFGFAIDGLYGMGHFLSFGIAAISAIFSFTPIKNTKLSKGKNLIIVLLLMIFAWHGIVKFSIWRGMDQFENHQYSSAIPHLERAVTMYPKPIGRFHLILAEMYLDNGDFVNAKEHAIKAQKINPGHDGPRELLERIGVNE